MKVEFIKFGHAVSINNQNMNSAHNREFNIDHISDFVFTVASKKAPEVITHVALTNVSEWRYEKQIAKKSKTNS